MNNDKRSWKMMEIKDGMVLRSLKIKHEACPIGVCLKRNKGRSGYVRIKNCKRRCELIKCSNFEVCK